MGLLSFVLPGCRKEEKAPEVPASSPVSYMNDPVFRKQISDKRKELQAIVAERKPLADRMQELVKEHGEDVIFLRKIERGGADKSFGIHVAHLAGLPRPVIMRAHEILARLETNDVNQTSIGQNILGDNLDKKPKQVNLFEAPAMDLVEEIRALDVMAMTPIEALNTLFTLREKARRA